MTGDSICATGLQPDTDAEERLFDNWFDPTEEGLRERVRDFIEAMIHGELDAVLVPAGGRRTAMASRIPPAWLGIRTAAGRASSPARSG